MKPTDLIKVIRKLIKEEVQKTVAEEVNKSMAKILAEIINNKTANNELLSSNNTVSPQKTYTKNPKLNEALNQTMVELSQGKTSKKITENVSSRLSLTEAFDKIDSHSDIVRPDNGEVVLDTSSTINMLKSVVSTEPVGQQVSVLDTPNPLSSVFKKDFRKIMKKIDEKKASGGSGLFAGRIPTIG